MFIIFSRGNTVERKCENPTWIYKPNLTKNKHFMTWFWRIIMLVNEKFFFIFFNKLFLNACVYRLILKIMNHRYCILLKNANTFISTVYFLLFRGKSNIIIYYSYIVYEIIVFRLRFTNNSAGAFRMNISYFQ